MMPRSSLMRRHRGDHSRKFQNLLNLPEASLLAIQAQRFRLLRPLETFRYSKPHRIPVLNFRHSFLPLLKLYDPRKTN